MSCSPDLDPARSGIQPASEEGAGQGDYLRYLTTLASEMAGLEASLESGLPASVTLQQPGPLGSADAPEPKLGTGTLRVDGAIARRALDAVVRTTTQHSPTAAKLQALLDYIGADDCRAAEVVLRAGARDRLYFRWLAATLDLDPAALYFAARVAAAPIWRNAASRLPAIHQMVREAGAESGRCPACGSRPRMSRLDEDGRRVLECPLCGTAWPAPRLKCPFCENSVDQTLGYLSVEGEPYRVDVCDRCRTYIKTLDRRGQDHSLRPPWLVEDAMTLHLDVLATGEGYASPSDE